MTDDLHEWRTAAYKHVQERDEARAERDGAYRERAQLTALLAAIYPSTLAYNDPTAPEWAVVYVTLPTGQCSWHVAPRDIDLLAHVRRDDSTLWDGHTTTEKYQRIAEHVTELAEADSYAAMINAPLRPETIAAIAERIKSGTMPVRKVKVRACPPECADGHLYDGGCLIDPQQMPDDTGALAVDRSKSLSWAWRCWGTENCEGWLSLDHGSAAEARRSYDRHCKREHQGDGGVVSGPR